MPHLHEDDLVLHYYGETSAGDEPRVQAHLAACGECQASLRRLQRVLAVMDERAVAGPELPESFERVVWARLEPNLSRDRGWVAWFLAPARLAWVAAVIVLVAGAFQAGRLSQRQSATSEGQTATTDAIRERILLVDLGDHLDRSRMVLVEVMGTNGDASVDLSGERARAEELVSASRLYRQTAAATGDSGVLALLDELERVLVDVATMSEDTSREELDVLRRRIASRELLFKVRVVSSSVRERQKPVVVDRTGQRSSL